MERAGAISARRLAARVGKTLQVLVDEVGAGTAVARSEADAPEIDGVVRVSHAGKLKAGDFARVRVTAASAYDLEARLI
jgi:ribosomal protein S12 methylthiotransferase